MNQQEFRVKADTSPNKLAAALIGATKDQEVVCVSGGLDALKRLTYALCIANTVAGTQLQAKFDFSGEKVPESAFRVKALITRG